ncbi:MAG: amidohydrolase family protein, partial [Chloroflexota bacterium]
ILCRGCRSMIIEWNAHMFSRDTGRYPFHPEAVYTPDASRLSDDPLADYVSRMDEEGIDHAVLVHPEPYGDDHRLVLDCLEREPERLHGTSLFFPRDPDGPRKLEELVKRQPKIISTRFHGMRGREQYMDSFDDEGVRALWDRAAELGLIVELHIGPQYARSAARRIAEHPDTPVLIDHLAEPHTGDTVEFADVLELAAYDNVYMKLSGLNHFSDDAPLYEDARPFTQRVIREFGSDRMVWGSGTPRIVDAHMPEHSDAERDKVRGGNLAQLLGL